MSFMPAGYEFSDSDSDSDFNNGMFFYHEMKNDSMKNDSLKNDSMENDSMKNDSTINDSMKNDSIINDSMKNDFMKNDSMENRFIKSNSAKNELVRKEQCFMTGPDQTKSGIVTADGSKSKVVWSNEVPFDPEMSQVKADETENIVLQTSKGTWKKDVSSSGVSSKNSNNDGIILTSQSDSLNYISDSTAKSGILDFENSIQPDQTTLKQLSTAILSNTNNSRNKKSEKDNNLTLKEDDGSIIRTENKIERLDCNDMIGFKNVIKRCETGNITKNVSFNLDESSAKFVQCEMKAKEEKVERSTFEYNIRSVINEGNIEKMENMIAQGVNFNDTLENGWSFITYSCFVCKFNVTRFLIEHAVDLTLGNMSCLHAVSCANYIHLNDFEDGLRILDEFLKLGLDINAVDKFGCTASMVAIFYGNLHILEYMLKRNADIFIKNYKEETVFHYAVKKKSVKVLQLMLFVHWTNYHKNLVEIQRTLKLKEDKELIVKILYFLKTSDMCCSNSVETFIERFIDDKVELVYPFTNIVHQEYLKKKYAVLNQKSYSSNDLYHFLSTIGLEHLYESFTKNDVDFAKLVKMGLDTIENCLGINREDAIEIFRFKNIVVVGGLDEGVFNLKSIDINLFDVSVACSNMKKHLNAMNSFCIGLEGIIQSSPSNFSFNRDILDNIQKNIDETIGMCHTLNASLSNMKDTSNKALRKKSNFKICFVGFFVVALPLAFCFARKLT